MKMKKKIERAKKISKSWGYISLISRTCQHIITQFRRKEAETRNHMTYEKKCQVGIVDRPHYGYYLYHAATLAKNLNYDSVSIIEFGVAGGKGLLNLEKHARQIEKEIDIKFEIYGFDTGEGLPAPTDYRDFPFKWQEGNYTMDVAKLTNKLDRAELILDDVSESTNYFFEEYNPAPVGAIMFDLDYYSSTRESFQIFDCDDECILPRVISYFDDIESGMLSQSNKYVGELRAIDKFNETSENEKIAKIKLNYNLHHNQHINPIRIYTYQRFDHPEYNTTIRELSDDSMSL